LAEKDLSIDDVLGADEIFLTNVIMQVMPITKVEKHTVGDGRVGLITKKLHKSFEEFMEKECGKDK
jgi:branched-subunit amino acid aminotransferase/4-amino-4-deoxychorismate lyase